MCNLGYMYNLQLRFKPIFFGKLSKRSAQIFWERKTRFKSCFPHPFVIFGQKRGDSVQGGVFRVITSQGIVIESTIGVEISVHIGGHIPVQIVTVQVVLYEVAGHIGVHIGVHRIDDIVHHTCGRSVVN